MLITSIRRRPRRLISEQIRVSPFLSFFSKAPSFRSFADLVPDMVSDTHLSICNSLTLQNFSISKRWIIPVITRNRYNKLIEGDTVLTEKLLEYVRRPLALLTIKKAVERLPVEVLPNGIVQVQQSTTVRDKLRAEKEARQSVANSLEQDAAAYLDVLQDIIRELDAQSETVDYYIPGVTVQSKGITF